MRKVADNNAKVMGDLANSVAEIHQKMNDMQLQLQLQAAMDGLSQTQRTPSVQQPPPNNPPTYCTMRNS